MAQFIVLRNGANYKVFDFDGNIARVGSGSTVDFQLEAAGIEGDLFFIARTPTGYEIERRARELFFTINGLPAGDRTLLKEGDKIGFLDYIMIVKYEPQEAPAVAPSVPPEPRPDVPEPVHRETTPAVPAVEAKPEPVPPPTPPKPARKGAAETTIIDSQALTAQGQQAASVSPPRSPDRPPAAPIRPEPHVSKPEPPKPPEKRRITPVYTLCVLTGQHKGRAFEIDTQEYVIGRDQTRCDLAIDHDEQGRPEGMISRVHCVITSADEGLYLTAKGSKLDTFVNRKIVEPGQREFIAPEDIISIPAPSGEVFARLCFRGQENFATVSFSGPINPRLIVIMAAAIVILVVALYLLLR